MMQAFSSDSPAQQKPMLPKNDQTHCLLFKLPPELRNCIYSYVTSQSEATRNLSDDSELPPDNSNQLTYHEDPSSNYNNHQSLPVVNLNQISDVKPSNALLGTCQRIYHEARAMFVASQHTFWKSHALIFDLRDNRSDDISAAQEILARMHAGQIDSVSKFSVALTMRDCLHTFHFLSDDIETTDDEINEGYAPNCGFCHGGCSHTGELSHADLRLMCRDLESELMRSTVHEPLFQAHDMKRYAARTRSRIAAYEKSAKAYLNIAARDRRSSRTEDHAMLRWEEERKRSLRKLESQDVNMKRLMFIAVIRHFCGMC